MEIYSLNVVLGKSRYNCTALNEEKRSLNIPELLSSVSRRIDRTWQSKSSRRIVYALIILLSLLFIGIALGSNWGEFKAKIAQFDYRYLVLAILLYPIGMLPTATAWHTLLNSVGIDLPYRINLRYYSLSLLPRHIPGFIPFIASRTLLYSEVRVPVGLSGAATAAETILLALTGFILSIILFPIGGVQNGELPISRWISVLSILILIGLLGSTPLINRWINHWLARKGVENIPVIKRGGLIRTILWMFAAWGGGGVILYYLTQSLQPVEPSQLPLFIAAWSVSGAVSLTIGIGIQGLGIREITLSALLSFIVPPITAILLAISFRVVLTVGEVLWVVFFSWITRQSSD